DETHFLLPIMTAVMVGKWTADLLIDSLYHKLIDLKCFPFLSDEPHVEECLDLYTVEDVMGRDVVTIPEIGSVALMAHILASCN
ncbi:chloride channel protein, partial [Nannochloropsis gaditana CCMP526]